MALSRPTKLHWLVSCCCVLLTGLVFSATLHPATISSPAYYLVNQALFVCVASYLLLPGARSLADALINSCASVALFAILSRLPGAAGVPATILLQVAVVVFCLGMSLWSLTQLLESLFPDRASTRITLILLLACISAAPVWLGPAMDIYQPRGALIDSIVSITPLTHFAVAAEYDYLRSDWLYRHSAFGSLPFTYPGFAAIGAAYFLFVLALRIILWRITRNPRMLE